MPRKSYPSSKAISGMYFPSSASSGNCIPFQASILGRTFPLDPQPETASHFERKFRDAFFESLPIRKARPTLDASGHGTIDLSGLPSIKRRPPGRRGTKFIASSARKEGHLMWPSSCAGLPEQAIKYIVGGHAAQLALRQRHAAKPAPTHARASAIEANKRVKRLRRNGALVAHNDAAANVDTHMTVDKARSTRAAVR